MDSFLGIPIAVGSAFLGVFGKGWLDTLKARNERHATDVDKGVKLEIHRDELTFELLTNARAEMAAARIEINELRSEVSTLRGLEQHMYHFDQSLEHLESVLLAQNPDARKAAERAARAFLNRMKRLRETKGVIANEVQRVDSAIAIADRKLKDQLP